MRSAFQRSWRQSCLQKTFQSATPPSPSSTSGGTGLARSPGMERQAEAMAFTAKRRAHARPRPPSLHLEPHGARGILQHYIRDLVYGANDGLITTFAVVAG